MPDSKYKNGTTYKEGDCRGSKNPNWKGGASYHYLKKIGKFVYKDKPAIVRIDKECTICEKSYKVIPSQKESKFCSRECYYKSLKGKDMTPLLKAIKWRDTKPEKIMQGALDRLGIEYIKHKHIGKYEIDFYLPKHRICLEVFGDYWHTKKEVSDRDTTKASFLVANGYRFLYYWEEDIQKNYRNLDDVIKEEIYQEGVGSHEPNNY